MERKYSDMSIPGNHTDRQKKFFENRYKNGNYLNIRFIASCRMHHDAALSLLGNCNLNSNISIVDIGCACGDFTYKLKNKFGSARVVGIDFVRKGLHVAKGRYPDIEFMQGALPDIPLANSTVDTAVCMEVLYYLEENALKLAIKDLHRIIVPNGYLLISTSINKSKRYFTEKNLLKVVEPYFELNYRSLENLRIYSKLMLIVKFVKKIFPNNGSVNKISNYILCNHQFGYLCQSFEKKLGKFTISNGAFFFIRKTIS